MRVSRSFSRRSRASSSFKKRAKPLPEGPELRQRLNLSPVNHVRASGARIALRTTLRDKCRSRATALMPPNACSRRILDIVRPYQHPGLAA